MVRGSWVDWQQFMITAILGPMANPADHDPGIMIGGACDGPLWSNGSPGSRPPGALGLLGSWGSWARGSDGLLEVVVDDVLGQRLQIGRPQEVAEVGAGALGVHVRGTGPALHVAAVHGPEVDGEPGLARRVRDRGVQ